MAEIEVFRARNTTGLAINGTRVTKTKPYGLIQTTQKFKVDDKEITKAIRIDVQPVKHGRWESSQRTIETGTVYCSNCAIEYYISDLQTVGDCNGIVHYCPNCGARMDGDTE